MRVLVAGGTGFIGKYLVDSLIKSGNAVTVLGRSQDKINNIFEHTVRALTWDNIEVKHVCAHDLVINLVGFNIGAKRWSPRVKYQIISSRVQATEKLVALLLQCAEKKPRFMNASAVGIYGLHENNPEQPQPVTEAWSIPFGKPTDFVGKVGQAWEQALKPAVKAGVSVVAMRFGVVLKAGEGALKKLLPSVKLGMASVVGDGKQGFTWIHIDDVVAVIRFLIEHPEIDGPCNVMSPEPTDQKTLMQALARAYHRPCFFKTPAWLIRFLLGEMGEELVLKGQRAVPERLLKVGFTFNYPDIESASKHL